MQCRNDILKSSRRLFSTKGYDETKMEDIAAKANVSKATLYNYFPNKESLLIGTVDDQYKEVKDKYDEMLESGLEPEERLYQILQILIFGALNYPVLSQRIAYLNVQKGSSLYHCMNPTIEFLQKMITEFKESSRFHPDVKPHQALEMLLGIYYVSLYHWKFTYPEDKDLILEKLDEAYWKTFTPLLI